MIKGMFLGFILGTFIGFGFGWRFRPPSTFPIDELKQAVEEKFGSATAVAREQLADFAEELARKLRTNENEHREDSGN